MSQTFYRHLYLLENKNNYLKKSIATWVSEYYQCDPVNGFLHACRWDMGICCSHDPLFTASGHQFTFSRYWNCPMHLLRSSRIKPFLISPICPSLIISLGPNFCLSGLFSIPPPPRGGTPLLKTPSTLPPPLSQGYMYVTGGANWQVIRFCVRSMVLSIKTVYWKTSSI